MKKTMCTLVCVFACVFPAAAEPDPVALELARIRASLDRLADLLEESRSGREAELLLLRIDRKEKRLIPLETRLRTARSDRSNIDEELLQLSAYREQMEQEQREARDRGESPEQVSRMLEEQLEFRVKALEGKGESLDRMIQDLEYQVAEQLEDIEDLEAALEEILARMPGSD